MRCVCCISSIYVFPHWYFLQRSAVGSGFSERGRAMTRGVKLSWNFGGDAGDAGEAERDESVKLLYFVHMPRLTDFDISF